MAVRVAGELAPCERVGENGSDTSNTGTDPTPLTSGYPPGPRCRCSGQGNACYRRGGRAEVEQSTESTWGEPVVCVCEGADAETPTRLAYPHEGNCRAVPGGSSPVEALRATLEGFVSGLVSLPRFIRGPEPF